MSSKIKNKLMLDYPQEADINCRQCIQQEKDHTITKGINLHKKVLQFIKLGMKGESSELPQEI